MGESSDAPLKLEFDRRVRLEFRGATITPGARLLACRELDAALGLTVTANDYIHERRTGCNVQHRLLPMLRESVYSRLAGYEDTIDAERLARDPAMSVIVGWQGTDKRATSTNTMSRSLSQNGLFVSMLPCMTSNRFSSSGCIGDRKLLFHLVTSILNL